MNTEQAIKTITEFMEDYDSHISGHSYYDISITDEFNNALLESLEALREKAERENPKPLTLEELMQRDGKPVFVVSGDKKDELNGWFIVSASIHKIESEHGVDECYNLSLFNAENELIPEQAWYGMTYEPDVEYGAQFGLHLLGWLAFDHEPKEAHDGR